MNTQLHSYEPMLKESVKQFIASYYSNTGESSNFSAFESIFFRLIQTMLDPPLEITWFYSAVTSHASKLTKLTSPVAKILSVKDLFQFLVSSSNLSSGSKKIAVLAPVVYELYNIMCDFSNDGSYWLRGDVEELVEKIVGYVSICCEYRENVNEVDNVVVCIEDLVRLWTLDRVGKNCKFGDNARVFFPVLSDEVRKGVSDRFRTEELAGIVMCEVFSMKLCGLGVLTEETVSSTRQWASHTIKGFRNYYFLDGLFKMLLNPSLPVSSLLSSEDAVFLQKAVYDAVVLLDYSFLLSDKWNLTPDKLKKLALEWSLVAGKAIQFARRICDEAREISYVNAFSESLFLNQLTLWINQADKEETLRPNIRTPRTLINRLLFLEDQGLRVFVDDDIKSHAKAIVSSSMEQLLPEFMQFCKIPPADLCVDTAHPDGQQEHGVNLDEEMIDSFDGGCPTVSTNTITTDASRKRKDGTEDVGGTRMKLPKYNCHGSSSIEEKFSPFSHVDAVNAGSS